jgi:hypothetical protein
MSESVVSAQWRRRGRPPGRRPAGHCAMPPVPCHTPHCDFVSSPTTFAVFKGSSPANVSGRDRARRRRGALQSGADAGRGTVQGSRYFDSARETSRPSRRRPRRTGNDRTFSLKLARIPVIYKFRHGGRLPYGLPSQVSEFAAVSYSTVTVGAWPGTRAKPWPDPGRRWLSRCYCPRRRQAARPGTGDNLNGPGSQAGKLYHDEP